MPLWGNFAHYINHSIIMTQNTIKSKALKAIVVYAGKSLYDDSPIAVVLTKNSKNSKTGDMIQSWIIRTDVNPIEASRTGKDFAICGNCIHRGMVNKNDKGVATARSCYVALHHAPLAVYKAYNRDSYARAETIDQVKDFLVGNMLRIGSYGDPGAVPVDMWNMLIDFADGHTAYTHAHSVNKALGDSNAEFSMVSADNRIHAILAQSDGHRTFRVIPISTWKEQGKESLLPNEVLCPASKEMEYKTTCYDCKLCSGTTIKAKSIAIVAHGNSAINLSGY